MINDFIQQEKKILDTKPSSTIFGQALGSKVFVPQLSQHTYNEKYLAEFSQEAFILSDAKIVLDGRKFGLQVEFMTPKFKKLTYIIKKPAIQSVMLF